MIEQIKKQEMMEQIEKVFEGMTDGDLEELKQFFKNIQEDAKKDLKEILLDNELKDKKTIVTASLPLLLSLGGSDIAEIIRTIEKQRKIRGLFDEVISKVTK